MAAVARSWLVAETLHAEEAIALRNLNQQSHTTYLARFRERRNAKGVRKVMPLFPGYIFVQKSDRWHSVNGTRGVRRVIMSASGTPSLLSNSAVEWIRNNEDELGYYRLESEEPPAFSLHQAVLATRGMFREQTGKFVQRTSHARCRVLFQLLGKSVESDMLLEDLVPQV